MTKVATLFTNARVEASKLIESRLGDLDVEWHVMSPAMALTDKDKDLATMPTNDGGGVNHQDQLRYQRERDQFLTDQENELHAAEKKRRIDVYESQIGIAGFYQPGKDLKPSSTSVEGKRLEDNFLKFCKNIWGTEENLREFLTV